MTTPGRLAALALLTTVLVAGCAGPDADVTPAARPAEPSTTARPLVDPTPRRPAYVRPDSPLVQRLWRPLAELRRMDTALPPRLDFDVVQTATPLSDAPIPRAVLAVGREPEAYGWGEVVVMSPAGRWRRVERDGLGMRDPDLEEQQFELSPDGRTLALGDERGVVFVDLATAGSVRVPVPTRDPVLHWWTPDSAGVVVTPRGANPVTWVVGPDRGAAPLRAAHPWFSSVGPDGAVVELAPHTAEPGRAGRTSFAELRRWEAGRLVSAVPMPVAVPQDARPGEHWSSLLPVVQHRAPRAGPRAQGVIALDPRSGEPIGVLELAEPHIRWVSSPGAVGDSWILLAVPSGPGGGLAAWDPETARLRAVMEIEDRGAVLSIAPGLVARGP
ncbi:hypothetical protein [Nocardioides sp. 1609]|uniref:hypothetical protein n=1 Tax=Nocardioides sp. 1609 TaxID=2508327 RepID=UPI0010706398|nr:hypothetical protein [Nocardioides sp. 1609]